MRLLPPYRFARLPSARTPMTTVNVRLAGAIGDGLADDTAALQSAIDTANDIYIPEGRYKISAPLRFHARTGVQFRGDGWRSEFLVAGNIASALDLNGISRCYFSGFRIRTAGANDSVDHGVHYRWDGVVPRSTHHNVFERIRIDGRFKVAFHIGSDPALNLGFQEDHSVWRDCYSRGQWTPTYVGDLWQAGFRVGSGKFANNLIHTIDNITSVGHLYGVEVRAGQCAIRGGGLAANGVDFKLQGMTSYFRAEGLRSELSGRLLESGGPVGYCSTPTLADILWRITDRMHADRRVVLWQYPGCLVLDQVQITGLESADPPLLPLIACYGNRGATPVRRLCVEIRGGAIGGGQTLASALQYDSSTSFNIYGWSQVGPSGMLDQWTRKEIN